MLENGESKGLNGSGKKAAGHLKAGSEKMKEQHIQILVKLLVGRGYQVRRERLKRGQGWQVQSGAAAVFGEPTIFVDRNLRLEEQLEVVVNQLREQQFELTPEELTNIPGSLLKMFYNNGSINKSDTAVACH